MTICDNFFQREENIMKQTKAQILEVLTDEAKGKEPMDKLRLFIIPNFIIIILMIRIDLSRNSLIDIPLHNPINPPIDVKYISNVIHITR